MTGGEDSAGHECRRGLRGRCRRPVRAQPVPELVWGRRTAPSEGILTTPTAPPTAHPWVAEQDSRVRFGIFSGPGDDWVREVERLGFDSFWVGDHPAGSGDCWTRLAVLAGLTERIRLGPLVSCVYYRLP